MDKNRICEALFALPDNLIEKRRRPLLPALLLGSIGLICVVLNIVYGDRLSIDGRSALVVSGGLLFAMGVLIASVRLLGGRRDPCFRGERLICNELCFGSESRSDVVDYISRGEVEPLLDMNHSEIPVVSVVVYRSRKNDFVAMQAFEYVELEYRPITDLKIVHK